MPDEIANILKKVLFTEDVDSFNLWKWPEASLMAEQMTERTLQRLYLAGFEIRPINSNKRPRNDDED